MDRYLECVSNQAHKVIIQKSRLKSICFFTNYTQTLKHKTDILINYTIFFFDKSVYLKPDGITQITTNYPIIYIYCDYYYYYCTVQIIQFRLIIQIF